jgi:uncharacterized membrane protein YkvI
MPVIVILLIAAMVASFGFWDTIQAILGAVGAIILFIALAIGVVAATFAWLANRAKRKFRGS